MRVLPRAGLVRDVRHHVLCRAHTAESLARAMSVSVATVARALASLRRALEKEGMGLVSVKEGRAWRYEIREPSGSSWASDPFVRGVGFAEGVRRPRGQTVDDALYGRRRGRR